ncbi:ABC transporter permease [Roseovarius sp. MMSF_3281]|uniref:ABC transporter permease n=1 Tax=Roseovarius sp. MMSF_3281 TaxID=3046694 RepID=UPI00273D17F8|nr:ABC transporter permease [Roseovarius sp. MMSF_3281]
MYAYIIRRLIATIPIMAIVAVFVFMLLHLSPGDPAAIIAGDFATEEQIIKIREQLGLNDPLYIQFGSWLVNLLQGDMGQSIYSGLPVTKLIGQRLEPTLMLTLCTMLIAITLAIPLGVIAAWKVGTWIDRMVMTLAVFGFSVPVFVIGYLLILGGSRTLGWFPVQGYTSILESVPGFLSHIALPALTLGAVYMALIARMTRATMLEVLNEDYVRTAYAKGLATRKVLVKHALKNAMVPISTTIGLGVALLIGGVVVTESVFAIPGLGRLTVDAVLRTDYPVIQGVILVFSFTYVLLNLLIDLSYVLFDPRIRY